MFISKMTLLYNETGMAYETEYNYLLYCCKYFEIFVVPEVYMYIYVTHTRFEGWSPRCGGKHASDVEAGLLIKTVNIPSTKRGGRYLGLQAGASHN